MKIKSLHIVNYKPIKNVEINNLGDVVIIAGANGAGKTRLMEAIVATVQNNPLMDMTIEATRDEESDEKYFNGQTIELKKGTVNQSFANYINSRKFGQGNYVGSLVQIDSRRTIETLKYNQISYQVADPDDADTPAAWGYGLFKDRWQDFMNYIHQKVAAHSYMLARELMNNPKKLVGQY